MRRKALVVAGMLSLTWLAAGVLPLAAQDEAIPVALRYAVKFVCGEPAQHGASDAELPFTRGRYHTAINVHNPSLHDAVVFVKKVAVASASPYEGGQHPGKVTPFVQAALKANEAFEIDCPEIARVTELPISEAAYIKGFVVLLSPHELDVVAVYTARGTAASHYVSTLQVLPVTGSEQYEYVSVPRPKPE